MKFFLFLSSFGLMGIFTGCSSLDSSDSAEFERLQAGGELAEDEQEEMDDSISGSTGAGE
ncbi:MAG: hypothetical protein AAGJ81_03160 [Verrucomicrobiota bacterium]